MFYHRIFRYRFSNLFLQRSGKTFCTKTLSRVDPIVSTSCVTAITDALHLDHYETRFYNSGYDIRTEVLGSEGAVTIGAHQHTPVVLLTRNGAQHDTVPYLMERFGDAYHAQIQHFADCLRTGKPPSVGGTDALAALEIGIAATRAYQMSRIVTLDELHP